MLEYPAMNPMHNASMHDQTSRLPAEPNASTEHHHTAVALKRSGPSPAGQLPCESRVTHPCGGPQKLCLWEVPPLLDPPKIFLRWRAKSELRPVQLELAAMSVDKGIVIEGISVQSLGYKSSSHSTWSPFLKFEIGSNVHKTSTLKHVPAGQDLVWQGETLRFPANAGDMLTVSAFRALPLASDIALLTLRY